MRGETATVFLSLCNPSKTGAQGGEVITSEKRRQCLVPPPLLSGAASSLLLPQLHRPFFAHVGNCCRIHNPNFPGRLHPRQGPIPLDEAFRATSRPMINLQRSSLRLQCAPPARLSAQHRPPPPCPRYTHTQQTAASQRDDVLYTDTHTPPR